MWKNKVNLRVILLLALLAGCVGVYARYDRLRREAIGLPRTDTALHQVGWLASRLSDFARFGLQRHLDAWTSACVRRAWPGDDCRKRCGGEYRDELGRTAAAIGEVEPAFATLYAPGAESPARLLALRDWFRAEAADDEVWTCTRGGMLEKLDQLKGVVAAHADCLHRLAMREAVDVYHAGTPVPDDCAAALRTRPLPEHVASAQTAPDGGPAGEGAEPLAKPRDRVLKLLVGYPKEISFVVSPDGSRLAYVVERDGKQLVVVDGVEGSAYDAVWTGVNANGVVFADYPGGPVFSADSRHVAYQAQRDGKWFIVLDGREGTPWDAIDGFALGARARLAYAALRDHRLRVVVDGKEFGPYQYIGPRLVFSPDASRVAWVVKDEGGFSVVVDGRPGPAYAEILPPGVVFSPDGRRVAYQARGRNGTVVVVDGHETPAYQHLFPPVIVFSPDSRRVAYLAERNRRLVAIVDGREEREYDGIGTPAFSPDSSRCFYGAKTGRKWFVVVNGEESGPYDGLGVAGVVVSPNSKHLAYAATDARGTRLVLDGRDGPSYESIALGSPVFSPDSAHVAYVATRGSRMFAVFDGLEGAAYDRIAGNVTFSPDSARAAYFVQRPEGRHLVVNGKEDAAHEEIITPAPVFSPDSRHVAYVAKHAGWKLVVEDGAEHTGYRDLDETSLRYSPDSAHLAYAAWEGDWRLVIDRALRADRFFAFPKAAPLRFDAAGHLHGVAQTSSDGGFTRLDIDLGAEPGLGAVSRREP